MNESLREMNINEALVADTGVVGYRETERLKIGANTAEIRAFQGNINDYSSEDSLDTQNGGNLVAEKTTAGKWALGSFGVSYLSGVVAFAAFQAYSPAFIYATYWGLGNLLALTIFSSVISGVALAAGIFFGVRYLYKMYQANK